MLINEVICPLKKFLATVSVKGTQARTTSEADSESQARLLLGKQYGEKTVVSVSHVNLSEQMVVSPIPNEVKHQQMVNYLTNKIIKLANRPRFTQADIRAAGER